MKYLAYFLLLWCITSAVPTTKRLKVSGETQDLSLMSQPIPDNIGQFLTLKEKYNFAMVKKENIFSKGLLLSNVISESDRLGDKLTHHCKGDAADFQAAFSNITMAIDYVKLKMGKIVGDERFERLSEFEDAASFYFKLTTSLLKCSFKLNKYDMAVSRATMTRLQTYKTEHHSFDGFVMNELTDDEFRAAIDSLVFTAEMAEREKLIVTLLVDKLTFPLLEEDLVEYVHEHNWNACNEADKDEATCKYEVARMLSLLNYVCSQVIASLTVSATFFRIDSYRGLLSEEEGVFYETYAANLGALNFAATAKMKISPHQILREFFQRNGKYYDYGPAAFMSAFLLQEEVSINNIDDLKLISQNSGMSINFRRNVANVRGLYDNAKDVVFNCLNVDECDATKEITQEILVETFCLPPSLSFEELKSTLETDRFWDREMRCISSSLLE